MIRIQCLTLAAACALLSACGGGDSGGNTAPPTGGGGGGGNTPPPTISYKKYTELTGDQSFKTGCAGLTSASERIDAFGFGRYQDIPTTISIDYAAATQSWRTVGQSYFAKPIDWTFTPAMIQASPPADAIYYRKDNPDGTAERFYISARPLGAQAPEYVRASLLTYRVDTDPPEYRYCVFGVPTELNDTRPTTTVTYANASVGGFALFGSGSTIGSYDLGESTVTISANPTNGELPVTLRLIGRQYTPSGLSETRTDLGTYSGRAVVSQTLQSFNDALTDSPDRGLLGGNFAGWFFGPQGIEIGFAYSVKAFGPDGSIVTAAGAVTARR